MKDIQEIEQNEQEIKNYGLQLDGFHEAFFDKARSIFDILINKKAYIGSKCGRVKSTSVEVYGESGWGLVIYLHEYKRPIFVNHDRLDTIRFVLDKSHE